MVREVRALGLETCATLGMLTPRAGARAEGRRPRLLQPQPRHLAEASTARSSRPAPTRTASTRCRRCATPGSSVCCGGILGMGESELDRVGLLHTLATLPQHPESVPINQLVQVPGTPLHGLPPLDPLDFVRTIADRPAADAAFPRAALRGPHRHERRRAGAVLPGRRELDLPRREAADDAEPGPQPRRASCSHASASRPSPRPRPDPGPARHPAVDAEQQLAAGLAALAARRTFAPSADASTASRRRTRPPAGRRARLPRLLQQRLPRPRDHPAVTEAFAASARDWGVGSGASHLVSGHCREHHALEEELAAVRRPAARTAVLDRLHGESRRRSRAAGRGDRVVDDRLNHASLLDAGLATGARLARYAHGDVAALRAPHWRSLPAVCASPDAAS